jgi:hypothetical protein
MDHFERAIKLSTPGNDDAILRWNTCARVIMQNPNIEPLSDNDRSDIWTSDEAPSRIADS